MGFDACDFEQIWPSCIGGHWELHGDAVLTVDDPATGAPLARVACAGVAEVDRAVTAARAAFRASQAEGAHPKLRAEMMLRIAATIRARREDGARVLCLESGKAMRDALDEFDEAARYFEYYAGMADKIEGKTVPLGDRYVDFTVYEPYGVSAQIVPWNFPVSLAARSLAPALAAGNAVVLKSPELTPLAMIVLVDCCIEAGTPSGLVNLVCGLGREAGAALAAHADIDQIVFTGSVQTGQQILRAAAERTLPCVVELGGKSAGIVFEDADLERVLDSVRSGIFMNAGQICSAMSRLIVHSSIYERTVNAVADLISSLRVGPGIEDAELTPVISAAQSHRIASLCDSAVAQGARLVRGGRPLDRAGYFFAPTLFADVLPDMSIARQEVFGPVLVAMRFEHEDEAVALANDTDFGLVAGIFTRDISRAMRCMRKMESGQVFVNQWFAGGIETPFGGRKRSGYGREKGQEALYNYVQTKNIGIAL